jgi:hypothetical protein
MSAPGHHGRRLAQAQRGAPPAVQQALLAEAPEVLRDYVAALVAHAPGRGLARLKRLLQFKRTYPAEPFLAAVTQALAYGLYDLNRLESLILRQVRGDVLPAPGAGLMRAQLHTLLAELHFAGMDAGLDAVLDAAEQAADPPAAVLLRLLREESRHRQERSLAYRLAQARLPWDWSLQTFPFAQQPSVDASQIRALAGLQFIERGPTTWSSSARPAPARRGWPSACCARPWSTATAGASTTPRT